MPLIASLRLLFGLLSLCVLALGAWLAWTWYQGDLVRDAEGVLHRVREDWRLWTALALLAWSFLGRLALPLLLARGDDGPPTRAIRGEGRMIVGASGARLYVESVGPAKGPEILLTHGWGLDSTIWNYAKRDLAAAHRVLTWDLPGLGRSKLARDGALSLTDFAADLGFLIDQSPYAPVVLVGHSIGGMTIQTLALDNPELFARKVCGVVLINTTHTNPLKTMILAPLAQALRWPVIEPLMRLTIWLQPLAWLSSWQSYFSGSTHLAMRFGFGRFVTRSQLEHTALLSTRNPPGVQAKGNLAMFRWDATGALRDVGCPVLVLGGDMDIITKVEASRTIAAETRRAGLQVVRGVNHMGFLERPDLYNRAILEFVASLPSAVERGAPAATPDRGVQFVD